MVALVIIYNHRYDANIPILEKIYGERFSNIYHLVPFYDGDKENVIAVYDNSYYFESYIAQAYRTLKSFGNFEHYIFVADDLILNTSITENNYKEEYKISTEETFYPKFLSLDRRYKDRWLNLQHILYFRIAPSGLEVKNELPGYNEIMKKFEENDLMIPKLEIKDIYTLPDRKKYGNSIKGLYSYWRKKREIKKLPKLKNINLDIPLISGFSDHFVIADSDFKSFAHLCGIFAASRLFVEFAIPTALVISCKHKIKTEDNIDKKSVTYWMDDRVEFENKYNLSLNNLLNSFPEGDLFIHPVKLSKWK